MPDLLSVKYEDDILPEYRETPIGMLLQYDNLDKPCAVFDKAQLLI